MQDRRARGGFELNIAWHDDSSSCGGGRAPFVDCTRRDPCRSARGRAHGESNPAGLRRGQVTGLGPGAWVVLPALARLLARHARRSASCTRVRRVLAAQNADGACRRRGALDAPSCDATESAEDGRGARRACHGKQRARGRDGGLSQAWTGAVWCAQTRMGRQIVGGGPGSWRGILRIPRQWA